MAHTPESDHDRAVGNVTEAREELHALVKPTEGPAGGSTVIDNRGVRALLAPLNRFPAARHPTQRAAPHIPRFGAEGTR